MAAGPRKHVLFGAAYYCEYQPTPRLEMDLNLMAEASCSVIRVGESVWTTWEPEDGRFDLDWLEPVLAGADQRGIGVILGTPRTLPRRGWLAVTRRSPPNPRPGIQRRGVPAKRSTTPTRRSSSTPKDSSARSFPATPAIQR